MACAAFSLLCFAPLTVLNGLFGASVVCFTTSYAMPTCLLLANRRNLPSNRYFNLRAAGPVVNVVAICWMIISALFVCFPQYMPVTMDTMNWAPVIFGLVLSISLANWFRAKATYRCPQGLLLDQSGWRSVQSQFGSSGNEIWDCRVSTWTASRLIKKMEFVISLNLAYK
jgi:amino acid transporter